MAGKDTVSNEEDCAIIRGGKQAGKGDKDMPEIIFEGPKMEREKKAQLVREFTESASRITGIPQEAFIVLLKENDPENVGVGGQLLADRLREG